MRGPELPDEFEWPQATVRWWETWRTSAQATTFTSTDWEFLLDTALLHAAFWTGETSVGAELRLRVAKFGATPEDRARMRMQVGEPTPKPDTAGGQGKPAPPNVARLADRRKRLSGA